MKWISLTIIAVLIIWLWPDSSHRKDLEQERSKAVNSFSPQGTGQGSRTTRNSKKQFSNKELGTRISTLWDEISDDPRDPKVVEFIRLLREFGKLDEVAAFALMDSLEHEDHYKRWLMARVAIAGGWALRDPAAASKALFEDGNALPKNFEKKISPPFALPTDFTHPATSAQIAIHRQASYIFKAWSQINQEEASRFANSLPLDQSNESLRRMLFKHVRKIAISDSPGEVNRSSIDAILNNPNRTSFYHNSSYYGLEIHGNPVPEGEPAFTFEEWAARNPDLALEALEPKIVKSGPRPSQSWVSYPAWSTNILAGLARTNSDYLALLELGPQIDHFITASILAQTVSLSTADEAVWQLDGRESSWTLNFEKRKEAIQKIIDGGSFTTKEREELRSKMNGERTANDFIHLPELPNKTIR